MTTYKKNSISLTGAVGLGTGVMISAGIFALLGQVADLSGSWFPLMFILGGIVTGFSAYSYIKLSQEYPSAGGIGMFLVKAYGKGTAAATASLLMAFSMVINQSLVARTFGTYTLQLFGDDPHDFWIPLLGVGLLAFAFLVNLSGNAFIQSFTSIFSLIKIFGLSLFAIAALSVVGFSFAPASGGQSDISITWQSCMASIALTVLAFKGFTTITNSGSEIKHPKRNIGKAIFISILISLIVYLLLAWAVSSNLGIEQILKAKDYALAEAARPALGEGGVWLTVGIAMIATVTGIIASVFAVSRMLAMLTDMKLIPHRHFGMPGSIQKHTLVYTIVIAMALTIVFDLSRIASMGAILYLVMDMMIHWGVYHKLKGKVEARRGIVLGALVLDGAVLAAFCYVKILTDSHIVWISALVILLILAGEKKYLQKSLQKS
ncbi:APC family permease [Marinicrinis sediminis]|uniref:APC family permease n=1 Tax=Marinicrinis sediminis TaxID=1652465 RepID=A0ABW5REJ2_9BACL